MAWNTNGTSEICKESATKLWKTGHTVLRCRLNIVGVRRKATSTLIRPRSGTARLIKMSKDEVLKALNELKQTYAPLRMTPEPRMVGTDSERGNG